ncbi:hypothetical protein, partial [Burkholderia multivorans]|uniref:hypothetical protein n=1 Tax=Burkholderia multivorans TaxID=87883 RepID=UPI001BA3EA8C|nr:hypothetical protein [Burkholderia multivorans]
NPSATFRPLRPKRDTIGNLQRRLWNLFYFNQTASAIPGVIQFADTLPSVVLKPFAREGESIHRQR